MPALTPYLTFDGTCAQAFAFYETALGGKIEAMHPYSTAPASLCDQMPPGSGDKIMHALIRIDGQALMGSDGIPGRAQTGMSGFTLSLAYPNTAQATKAFAALAEGGKIGMALQPTFFAAIFGTVTDRFGTPWMIICEKEGL